MSRILIVTCTKAKTEAEFATRPIYKSLKHHYDMGAEMYVFKDNNRGLPICYNQILKHPENLDKIVLFVHDDVELEDMFMLDKVINSPYSITGVAGAKTFDKRAQKVAWHLASSRDQFVGEAGHTSQGRVWTTVFGPTNSRALVLDGVFLACRVKDLVEKDLYFNESFDFHFYDLSLCLDANDKKISCGVLPIRIVHHGLGDSMLTKEWEEANTKFKETYCK